MRKLPFSLLAVFATCAAIQIGAGCGSDGNDTVPPGSTDGSDDGANTGDGSANGDGSDNGDGSANNDGSLLDGQACLFTGEACGLASDCCSGACNKVGSTGECAAPSPGSDAGVVGGGTCLAGNSDCVNSTQCCSKSCVGNKCSTTQCKADSPVAASCTSNAECCSGKCDIGGTGKCVALAGGACRTEGNPCGVNADCCSHQCSANKLCVNLSYCTQSGDVCANDFECCGGTCNKAGGATLGRCGTVGTAPCNPAGSICQGSGCDNKCCSLSCGPLGTLTVCQPPSGCKPQDELCAKSSDCCGGPGQPPGLKSNRDPNEPVACVVGSGDTLGRCDSVQCLRPGDVCKAATGACGGTSNNCCESRFADGGLPSNGFCNDNPEACCSRDALGIPRCRAVNFVCNAGTTVPAGQLCSTSADCCGKPCVDNKCQASCVAKGGDCTINADCCSPEPCVVPVGQTHGICGGIVESDGGVIEPPPDSGTPPPPDGGTGGTCALYGQTCTKTADCCSGVPCTAGRCRYP